MSRKDELSANLALVYKRIERAALAAGRDPKEIQLLPVTKYHPISDIEALLNLGITAVGENRDQEAREKASMLPSMQFHMIGQVQTKKANSVARWANTVQSVDSLKLAQALNNGAARALDAGQREGLLRCMVQMSIDGDTARGGAHGAQIENLAEAIANAEFLELVGLMCVLPLGDHSFESAQQMFSKLRACYGNSLDFSAGMSGDLEQAISAGSTIVRVGTDILGRRVLG
ncbi:MAG: YggS family pyridoxal phosphate-dependent enzyme [Corynebacterium sp.]|nr:YggS family pyridoxal phosphate-dependent enzyme [Corynebacterium sp.]